MGITIHYKGNLTDPRQLPELTTRIKAACRQLDWQYDEINERVAGVLERLGSEPDPEDETTSFMVIDREPLDDHWRGLVIYPPGWENLYLTFNRSGRLVVYHSQFGSSPGTYWLEDPLSCKTQFSSPDIHISVCNLLRLAESFMAEWEVQDEGQYWEGGDPTKLARLFSELDELISHLTGETGRKDLEKILGRELSGKVEKGKTIGEIPPIWREHWGDSAQEN
jgi:hypothetical protein